MKPFTVVIPIKGTDVEKKLFKKSILSAINLNPDELILGVDYPFNLELKKQILELVEQTGYNKLRFIEVEKSSDWNFQLAHVIWECYKKTSYDYIFSFDIDSTVRKIVLSGLKWIGEDHVAVVSFTKRMPINSITKLIRHIFVRIRVWQSDFVFSGCYWVYRPYYFDSIKKNMLQKIHNGVDGILVEETLSQRKYKLITKKEKGVRCYTIGNEDMDWRQFQDGIWYFGNWRTLMKQRKKRYFERNKGLIQKRNTSFFAKIQLNLNKRKFEIIETNPIIFILIKAFAYQHWNMLRGFLWAKSNSNSDCVKKAKTVDKEAWGLFGSKYLPKLKWKNGGTGFIE